MRAASFGTMTSVAAFGVIVLGAVPMAAAQTTPGASTILAQAIDGDSSPIDIPAPGFSLTDQNGRPVSLSGLRGKVVLLTFLDPVCVTDCPLIAQEFRQAAQLLGTSRAKVELVAVDVNPLYTQLPYLQAFDREEGLAATPDWRYLTGSTPSLTRVYKAYGQPAETLGRRDGRPQRHRLRHRRPRGDTRGTGHGSRPGHGGDRGVVRHRTGRRGDPGPARLMNTRRQVWPLAHGRRMAAALALAVLAAGCGNAAGHPRQSRSRRGPRRWR